ncbi:MAG: hypothetical protein GY855_02695 [candidate division Zixibacteria bacterium]|nr:hypothetical protein [candidate division Zixibacteria bacterium]
MAGVLIYGKIGITVALVSTKYSYRVIKMKCYFYGSTSPEDDKSGIISFVIPEYGISFKTVWTSDILECQYLGMLSLLRFIEVNRKNFKREKIEILSDSSSIINSFCGCQSPNTRYEKLHSTLLEYTEILNFSLRWIPLMENKAFKGICNYPSNNELSKLSFLMPDEFDG